MEVVNQAGQLLFSLSFLIILHELGHFVPAKLFKIKVEKFYLFFDPYFSLVKKKIGETTYGIGWLPLGGYVKIAGMIDESMDKDQMAKEPEDWEFRSKPAWQRLIVMLGGVTVNVILAIVIYIGVMFAYGRTYIENDSLQHGIAVVNEDVEKGLGLKTGDKIVSINGEDVRKGDFSRVMKVLFFAEQVEIERNGEIIQYEKPETAFKTMLKYKDSISTPLVYHRYPFFVDSVMVNSNAAESGLEKGDKIVAVNGSKITFYDQFQRIMLEENPEEINLSVNRGGDTLQLVSKVTDGKLGFHAGIDHDNENCFDIKKDKYSFGESVAEGFEESKFQLWFYYLNFKQLFNFSSEAYKGVGGFKAFGSMFQTSWNWESIWKNTAFISIILAFMNLLPIPALDGGHAMFLSYEMITGRKPHEKLMEYAQVAGMILLLVVVLAANINDWIPK